MRNAALVFDLLGIPASVPLTREDMARELKVTFIPPHRHSERLDAFSTLLKKVLKELGTEVIPYEEALAPGKEGRIKPGIVIFEQGEGRDGELGIDRVYGLYQNPVVALFESAPPIPEDPTLQETLDSIVGVLAWNLAHVPIFVESEKWTICTMNGAVIECGSDEELKKDVLQSLVPKLSAQVVPPDREKILYREGVLDPEKEGYGHYIEDYMSSAAIWRENGLMLAHTSIDELDYRNRYYRRIVSKYLDHRTGMSYGFLVWQLPVDVKPALEFGSAPNELKNAEWSDSKLLVQGDTWYARIELDEKEWLVEIPDVWLLSTRSGCNKTNLNPDRDILRLGLEKGQIVLETPKKTPASQARPSYDTYAILAHAVGNVITSALMQAKHGETEYSRIFSTRGVSISHWHGYPDRAFELPGYIVHGTENPPVSCSTPQSAAFAFSGKLEAIEANLSMGNSYRGDVHVEPHHGTNITGCMTLTETADWVDRMTKSMVKSGAA
ncbi:MAG: hypothetical protein WDZ29_03495 [Balneolaceae bacterium]